MMKRTWPDVETTSKNSTDSNKRIKLPQRNSQLSETISSKNNDENECKDATIDNQECNSNRTVKERLCYKDKVILAPMVRVGTFPMRLLSLQYGADIVYNQELIDHKVIRFTRTENQRYQSIDFVDKSNDKLVFRTFRDEPCVFQIGSCDAVRCLKASTIIQHDVHGIDLNMGCPKSFSIAGGMGAALLSKPEVVEDIIKTLKRNLRSTIGITCKIRCIEDKQDMKCVNTIELCRRLEKLNIDALGIHGRYVKDRPRENARIKLIKPITDVMQIPCIYNGDIFNFEDIEMAKKMTGCSSVMIARGAQWNPSIFSKSKQYDPLDTVITNYLNISKRYNNLYANSKYVVVKMLCGKRWLCKSKVNTQFQKAKNWDDCYEACQALTKELKDYNNKHKNHNGDTLRHIYTDTSVFDKFNAD